MSTAAAAVGGVLDELADRAMKAWRPPRRLSLSSWADEHFRLSAETAAEPGPWHTLPYQREILDAITDPAVTYVTVMKSARVGFTLCVSAAIAYFIAHEPSSILVVQPTVDDAKGFSKETLAPMLRDVPLLRHLAVKDETAGGAKGSRDSSATLTHRAFPGGVLSLVGANSGTGFRRISRRVVIFDEVDAYPPSAGTEGDPIALGTKRSAYFHNRKIIAGSTPLLEGSSRIAEMFADGDQRRYHVPCPQCGHMDFLVFYEREDRRGHVMRWPKGEPRKAFYSCSANGCVIEYHRQRWMVEHGEWRADGPGGPHRSFAIWEAYSYSPNATWADIAIGYENAKRGGPAKLRTFENTTLGLTHKEAGEAPDWEYLHGRREHYPIGSVPTTEALFLTAGVDVQKDRFVYEVNAWLDTKESYSVDAGILWGDTSLETTWTKLDELLGRTFPVQGGGELPIRMMAVDSGYNTQQVYGWCRTKPMNRVIACKGVQTERSLVGAPSKVDVTVRGKKLARGYRVWPVGASLAKSELYGWLRLRIAEGEDPPPGYCHFPEYAEGFFKELTAEQLVTKRTKRGVVVHEWQLLPGRENHQLDARVLARAAANVCGLDRVRRKWARPPATLTPPAPTSLPPAATPPDSASTASASPPAPGPPLRPAPRKPPPLAKSGWLNGDRPPRAGGGGWFGRRR